MNRPLLRRATATAIALLAVGPLTALVGGPAPAAGAVTTDQIPAYYASHGGSAGPYGASLGAESALGGGRVEHFEHGEILWSPKTGTHGLLQRVARKYDAFGPFSLGFPTAETRRSGKVDGTYTTFQLGATFNYHWHESAWTFALTHTASHYLAIGGYGSKVGAPRSDEFDLVVDHVAIGSEVVGLHGNLFWSPATGTHEVHGKILTKWGSLGGPSGYLGFPTQDTGDVHGTTTPGRYSDFQGGTVVWSPSTGTHVVRGLIRAYWRGPVRMALGLPTADVAEAVPGVLTQTFEHGVMTDSHGHVSYRLHATVR